MSHEAICPCNLQCNFCQKKYCRLQLGCQTYATCFATCNEIFYARRVFKNVSGILIMSYCDRFLLKKIARHVAVGVSHAATSRVALRKVGAASSFYATWNPIFRSETSLKLWGVTRGTLPCHTRKSCDMALSSRFLALKPRCNLWYHELRAWVYVYFRCETSCKLWGVTRGSLPCHTRKSCNLQWSAIWVATCKENCLVWHGLKPSVSRLETSVKFVMSRITCMSVCIF